ncbi:unnamed protein product [Camellia sinensis]
MRDRRVKKEPGISWFELKMSLVSEDSSITVREIFSRRGGVEFVCGFYCFGSCTYYLFSVAIVGGGNRSVVWSTNEGHPVKEGATLQLTVDGELELQNSDGDHVWSTNTLGKSVVGMNTTEWENLVLFNNERAIVWQSFDYPTNTLLVGQQDEISYGEEVVMTGFKKAKENAPCIVFVDEIDAVGRQRGTGIGEGNDEREQTLNQLLTEMDGFEGNTGIIVIAATNRADILGSALLRPVTVDVPDIRGRTEILKVHGSNKKFDADVSLEVIAMRTPGFSGADLANLLNEAAILAGRRGKSAISSKEIDDSIDRIVAGMEGTVMTDGKSKSLVAYHEVGHAICGPFGPLLQGTIPFKKSPLFHEVSNNYLQELLVDLVERAAQEVIFGEPDVTTGAAGDLRQITGLAKQMVTTFGMSEIGPWSLMESSAQSADVTMRMMARNSMSEKLAEDIDTAVKRLSDRAYEIALTHIRNNREAIDKIVEILLEKETITGEEFRAILSEFVEIPAENRVPSPVPATVTV